MKRSLLALIVLLFLPQSLFAWNGAGHEVVAGIAWDNMTPKARQKAIAVLKGAPADACLLDLFPNDSRPLRQREREFFMRASTWADVVRPNDKPEQKDTRACVRFHRRDWHFINFFWEGTSGATGPNAPKDRTDIPVPEMNAVDRLTYFPSYVRCADGACGTTAAQRATTLAWILHLVGDIHQPLHTTARVTPATPKGDQGGNLFKLAPGEKAPGLHGYWDNILSTTMNLPEARSFAELDRAIKIITAENPRSAMITRLAPFRFEAWAREGFETTKRVVYPATLQELQPPSDDYRRMAFATAKPAVALAGYRLADLLNTTLR
jgi:hypothetical protein